MQDLLTFIVKSITQEPENITVSANTDSTGFTQLTITTPQSQVGRIIGKQGKTINAIRTIIRSSFPQEKFHIEIVEIGAENRPAETDTIRTQEDVVASAGEEIESAPPAEETPVEPKEEPAVEPPAEPAEEPEN